MHDEIPFFPLPCASRCAQAKKLKWAQFILLEAFLSSLTDKDFEDLLSS